MLRITDARSYFIRYYNRSQTFIRFVVEDFYSVHEIVSSIIYYLIDKHPTRYSIVSDENTHISEPKS